MPTYIVYDKLSGEILNVHREIMAETGETIELSNKEVIEAIKDSLPVGLKTSIAVVDEHPMPVRGYTYSIDLNTEKLMLLEKGPKKGSNMK